MTYQPFFSTMAQPHASGSSFKTKRKYVDDEEQNDLDQDKGKQMRMCSPPPFHRNTTFPPPDLMADHSASASDEDQAMDMDMDGDRDEVEHDGYGPGNTSPSIRDGEALYTFGGGGSGGFGFGPGAEEDEDMEEANIKSMYPSLTPHPNPNHFSNHPSHSPNSPWSAQPFTTSLRPVASPIRGVIQPSIAAPLPENASEIEKARATHGPQCKSIPKLVVSPYPDAVTGERSMWSVCQDCGAAERAA
ncbi:hypothetical protein BCR39DRAFT_518387 [Naematelia encephala]|uniref:Uncharacterized protein n=1 Tax=Naematelia encephala TaxID=71784 RepID=A0A1Y2BGZ3_9TREE|nr:hypothetical protein BCR39DRAFT_518387 [Naematelia encephala]